MLTNIEIPAADARWGKIYRSMMPFRDGNSALDKAHADGVRTAVVLVSWLEAKERIKLDLEAEYAKRGWRVIYFPIDDFGVPDIEPLRDAVRQATQVVRSGSSVLVHCSGGMGRTGMFIACMLRALCKLPAEEAISHVRELVIGAVETMGQEQAISDFLP